MTDRFWPVELTKQFGPRSIDDFLDWCERNSLVIVSRHNIHGGSNKMVLSRKGVLERYGRFRHYQENFDENHRAYCERADICVKCHETGFPLCSKHEAENA